MNEQLAPERIERYCKTTRWFHWTFALSFLGLAATGAALFLREELSLGNAWAETLVEAHQVLTVVFLTAPWLVAASGDSQRWLSDIGEILQFARHDRSWLVAQLRFWERAALPGQGKLNAGQKLCAIAIVVLSSLMVGTGLHLWREPGAFLALTLHLGSFVAWLPVIAVHLFMVLINPSTRPALRGMVSGTVDRAWARQHHARWVDRVERR